MAVETLTCTRCGSDWTREAVRGSKPTACPTCRSVPLPRPPTGLESAPGYRLARDVMVYRLAIENATTALREGRPAQALAILEDAEAPTRSRDLGRHNRRPT